MPSASAPPVSLASAPSASAPPAPSASAPPALSASAPPAPSASAPPAPSASAPLAPSSASPAQCASVLPPVSQAVQVAMAAPPPPTPGNEPSLLGPCPTGTPTWFVDARGQMTAVSLGCHFDALLAAWTRIEDVSRFEQGPTNLSHKGRPKQVGNWVSSSRGKKLYDASIPNIGQYAMTWQMWWDSLQPKWRKKGQDGNWERNGYGEGGREWGRLYQWGVNGMLNVVASLYFWGVALTGGSDGDVDLRVWEAGVGDVTWMLEGMATYYKLFKKKI